MTTERNKHVVVIEDGRIDHGRRRWTQEMAMRSDVDWIDSRLASACSQSSRFPNTILPDLVKGVKSKLAVDVLYIDIGGTLG